MIKHIKYIIIAMVACTLGSAANANKATVNPDHFASLQDAYKFVLSKSYDEAQDIYKDIQNSKDVESDIKRAAAEGEGLVLLLQLNIRILESKDDAVKVRFVRFQRRNTVGYLEKAFKTYKSDTLSYMLALAKETEELSEETFKDLRYSDEYVRLLNAEPEQPSDNNTTEPIPEPSQNTAPKTETGNVPVVVETPMKDTLFAAKSAVNIRSGPGVRYERIGGLSGGQIRTVVATVRLENGQVWLKFRGQSGFGYASSRLFTKATANQATSNNTTAKPVVAKPAVENKTTVKPVTAAAPANPKPAQNAGNKACAGGGRSSYSVKSKVAVLSSPGGPVIFSYNKNVRINIVNVQSGYLVLRIGQASGNFKCGYIRYDKSALKRIN